MADKIIVAMPAYNEESYIGTMVLKCAKYADEVYVVDDGSTDSTVEIATLAGAKIISNGKHMGLGVSVQNMLNEASKIEGLEALVMLDSDTQHLPEDIPNMLAPIAKGYDLILGSRNPKSIPFIRYVGNKILSLSSNYASNIKIKDTQCGFRCLSKKAIDSLVLKEKGMSVLAEMISESVKNNLKIIEVPISVKYTKDGSTFNPIQMGGTILSRIVYMISKRKPLTFFGIGGGIAVALGLLAGVIGYYNFMGNQVIPIGTFLVAMLLMIVGILSVFTGIMLNAIKRG
jgi:glycosyltransferase involved in cell wall biosynthesis